MSTEPLPTVHGADLWRVRLARLGGERPVVFVVGSGLSRGPGGRGVWDVDTIAGEATQRLAAMGLKTVATGIGAQNYQSAMEQLLAAAPDEANAVIRSAVLEACQARDKSAALRARGKEQQELCAQLQERPGDWYVPPGVAALADLIALLQRRRKTGAEAVCVITTNFDGLIEIALRKVGLPFQALSVVTDERPRLNPGEIGVWHVHGRWTDDATMHTQEALRANRPLLGKALQRHFDGAEICTLGYGGWKDVVFTTVVETMSGQFKTTPWVVWSFHEAREQLVPRYEHVFRAFDVPLGGQVGFFAGINLHAELPEAVRQAKVRPDPTHQPEPPEPSGEEREPAGQGDWEQRIRARLVELIRKTPAEHRPELERFLRAVPLVPQLIELVGACCTVLDQIGDTAQRSEFKLPARSLVRTSAGAVIAGLASVAVRRPEPLAVEVQTPLLVELLMARELGREPLFVSHARGARGKDLLFEDAEVSLPETGPADVDWIAAFESMIWRALFPQEPAYAKDRDRENLYGRLLAFDARKQRKYVIVSPATPERWNEHAQSAGAPSVAAPAVLAHLTLVQRAGEKNATLPLNEYALAHAINDFLSRAGT